MSFTYNGIEIRFKNDYTKGYTRQKVCTKIRSDLYKDIKELSAKTGIEITKIFDCLILGLYDDKYFEEFLKRLREY